MVRNDDPNKEKNVKSCTITYKTFEEFFDNFLYKKDDHILAVPPEDINENKRISIKNKLMGIIRKSKR